MEITKNQIEYKYGAAELHQEIKLFITDVKLIISENNFSLTEKSQKALDEYEGILWDTYINNLSKNMRKKLNKYLRGYYIKRNIHKANLLFHFIHTRILSKRKANTVFTNPDWINKVVIKSSLKEQAIQAKRKEWKKAQAIALELLVSYKEEKGDFYK